MHAATAVLTYPVSTIVLEDVATETAQEVSSLLLCAIRCVEKKDEMIAIDLMRQASNLLRPFSTEIQLERRRSSSSGLAPWQIKRVTNFIEEHISRPIALDQLSQVAKLSTSYFSAAFKATFGISPHNYIVEQRVAFAKHRMANSNAPLSEIALDCGMADQAHLSRVFRRATGTTPSAWRRYMASPNRGKEAA